MRLSIAGLCGNFSAVGLDVVVADVGGTGEGAEAVAQVLVVLDDVREGLHGGLFAGGIVHEQTDVVALRFAGAPNDFFYGHVSACGVLRTDVPVHILIAAVAHGLREANHGERVTRGAIVHHVAAATGEANDISRRARVLFDDALDFVEVGEIRFSRLVDGGAVRIGVCGNGVALSVRLADVFEVGLRLCCHEKGGLDTFTAQYVKNLGCGGRRTIVEGEIYHALACMVASHLRAVFILIAIHHLGGIGCLKIGLGCGGRVRGGWLRAECIGRGLRIGGDAINLLEGIWGIKRVRLGLLSASRQQESKGKEE